MISSSMTQEEMNAYYQIRHFFHCHKPGSFTTETIWIPARYGKCAIDLLDDLCKRNGFQLRNIISMPEMAKYDLDEIFEYGFGECDS